jgi:hypothetical protein
MDPTLESRQWRRAFAGGFAALALSLGGQMAVPAEPASCAAHEPPGIVEQLVGQVVPRMSGQAMAQRVGRLVLQLVLNSCRS